MSQEQERSAEAPSPPSLAEILQKQGELLEHIAEDQSAPLRLKELPHVKAGVKLPWTDFESDEVARLVGWPTRHTWAGEPSIQFDSGDSGDIEFFEKTVEPPRIDPDTGELYGLNNLWAILHMRPYAFDGKPPKSMLEASYSPMPVLIRAWTAFPEFMDALQRDLTEVRVMYKSLSEKEKVVAEEPHLLRGSRLAYGLMTRLIHKDDPTMQGKLQESRFPASVGTAPEKHYHTVTDPSRELWD